MPEFESPPPLPEGNKKTLAKRAAAYFLTLFRPWTGMSLPNLSYASWAEWVLQLQSTGTVLSLFRLAVMTRMSQGFAESADSAKINSQYRMRNCRFWNSTTPDGTAPPPGPHAPGNSENAEDDDAAVAAEAAAAIGELIRQAQGDESTAKEAAKLRSAQNSECLIDAVLRSYCQATAGSESDIRAHRLVPSTATAEHITSANHDWMVEDDAIEAQLPGPPAVGVADEQPGPHVWPDDTHLSASQRTAVQGIRRFLPGTAAPPTPFQVLGGPGTGKTFVARYLAECCEQLGVKARSSALAAAAAGLLPGGCTLHTLIGLGGRGKKAAGREGGGIPVDFSKPIASDKLRALRKKFSNVRLLIIDEISMVPVDLLGHVNHRLQVITGNAELFGGLVVVVTGDFDQLPPCTDPGLAARLMQTVLSGESVPAASAAASALSAFRACTTYFLTEQHRCADEAWKKILDDCRSSGNLAPIAGKLRQLSAGDCIADPRWRSATVATFGNRVRQVCCNSDLSLILSR